MRARCLAAQPDRLQATSLPSSAQRGGAAGCTNALRRVVRYQAVHFLRRRVQLPDLSPLGKGEASFVRLPAQAAGATAPPARTLSADSSDRVRPRCSSALWRLLRGWGARLHVLGVVVQVKGARAQLRKPLPHGCASQGGGAQSRALPQRTARPGPLATAHLAAPAAPSAAGAGRAQNPSPKWTPVPPLGCPRPRLRMCRRCRCC